MKLLLLLPLLLGFSVPAIAHNEFNGGDAMHRPRKPQNGCSDCIRTQKDNEFERE